MSAGARIPLHVARQVADRLVAALAPACERIEIAGSIRRGKLDVGDLEIVAIPKRDNQGSVLDRLLDTLIAQDKLWRVPHSPALRPAWGEKYKKCWLLINPHRGPIQVDLFLATPDNWGAIAVIRTGPEDFSRALVTYIRDRTPYKQDGGALIQKETGGVILVPDEERYFTAVGLPYIAPEKRTVAELRRVIAQTRRGV